MTAPVVPAQEGAVTGVVLAGFAVGWAMLVALSARFTPMPQRWAAVPAAFMASGAVVLLTVGDAAHPVLDWVWPFAALGLAGWMLPRVRRVPSRAGRRMLLPVVALLAVAGVGAGYQTVGGAVATPQRSMPGQLVDVGGRRLHLVCEGTGGPTVVLEPGAGEMAANLGWITPAVARKTRVCTYDRPGRGWSDPTETPHGGARVADDLHTLLHEAGVPGPYVLAGHSFGGLYVLAYAARYPEDVAGMVLIDSTAPATVDSASSVQDAATPPVLRRVSALLSTTSRLGLGRLYADVAVGALPAQARADVRASIAKPLTLRSTFDEYLAGAESTRDAAALRDLGDKPLAVLTAGEGHPDSWFAAQDHLATLSSRSVHRVVDGATHEGLVGEATYAAVTAQTITDVVAAARAGR